MDQTKLNFDLSLGSLSLERRSLKKIVKNTYADPCLLTLIITTQVFFVRVDEARVRNP